MDKIKNMKQLLNIATCAGIQAAKEILYLYDKDLKIEYKEDESPVTNADFNSNKIILDILKTTSIPILSEESEKYSSEYLNKLENYWCVDPIDGTQEFINKTGEYCVSIGLIDTKTSFLGVLAAPSLDLFYFAAEGVGCFKYGKSYKDLFSIIEKEDNIIDKLINDSKELDLSRNLGDKKKYVILVSRSNFTKRDQAYYEKIKVNHPNNQILRMGSAIKMGYIAEGIANLVHKGSSIHFWDIAAGHAIVKYAGGHIIDISTEKELEYTDTINFEIDGYIIKGK